MSFIDRIRESDEQWKTWTSSGFDPDLRTCGLARVSVQTSNHGRKRLVRAETWTIRSRSIKISIDAANAMVETILVHEHLFDAHEAWIEGQQVYPDAFKKRSELVATANDLIMLAHISGAAKALFVKHNCDADIILPAQWKGNRKKKPMHKEIANLLGSGSVASFVDDQPTDSVESINIHAKDALGMALRKAGYRV